MQKRVLACLLLGITMACGGSDAHRRVEEVPIDENLKRPTDLPPDEVGGPGSQATTTSSSGIPDHGPPPGVGPQSLDSPDAGASAGGGSDSGASPVSAFQQQPGGLSEKECTEVVMKYAKLMTREHRGTPTPSAAAIGQHPIYGQMIVECGKGTTKKQHKCGMGSRTSAAWKKCME